MIFSRVIFVCLLSIDLFYEHRFTKAGETLIQPHIIRCLAGHQITEPVVRELMRHQSLVIQCTISRKTWVCDIGGMLHRTTIKRNQRKTYPTPSIGSKSRLKIVDHIVHIHERVLQVGRVSRSSRQQYLIIPQ